MWLWCCMELPVYLLRRLGLYHSTILPLNGIRFTYSKNGLHGQIQTSINWIKFTNVFCYCWHKCCFTHRLGIGLQNIYTNNLVRDACTESDETELWVWLYWDKQQYTDDGIYCYPECVKMMMILPMWTIYWVFLVPELVPVLYIWLWRALSSSFLHYSLR